MERWPEHFDTLFQAEILKIPADDPRPASYHFEQERLSFGASRERTRPVYRSGLAHKLIVYGSIHDSAKCGVIAVSERKRIVV
jgi:hypothetical protein